jgi:uncharacterized membrane protein
MTKLLWLLLGAVAMIAAILLTAHPTAPPECVKGSIIAVTTGCG